MKELIKDWLYHKEQLKLHQELERTLREQILFESFGEGNIGSRNTVADGYVIKGSFGISYSFNQADLKDAINLGLLSDEALDVIRTKYELDKKAYDSLGIMATAEIDNYITTKPTLPTLEIKPVE